VAGLVPAIHVFDSLTNKEVDARHKVFARPATPGPSAGHDG